MKYLSGLNNKVGSRFLIYVALGVILLLISLIIGGLSYVTQTLRNYLFGATAGMVILILLTLFRKYKPNGIKKIFRG